MKKIVLTLTLLGIISALLLAFVYQITTPIIEEHQEKARREAVLNVLPESDSYQEVEKNGIIFYEGNVENELALIVSGSGFQGEIEIMVGVNPTDGMIYAIRVLNHSETPGLGANITTDRFLANFENKPFGDYDVVKRPINNEYEVEGISGATISSENVSTIIESAIEKVSTVYGGEA
ncbi:RnfABCDGE type electron transport complex subunit G [Natronospora cellulosivora (SeqCode)]